MEQVEHIVIKFMPGIQAKGYCEDVAKIRTDCFVVVSSNATDVQNELAENSGWFRV